MRKSIVRSAKPTTDGGFRPASDDGQQSWFRREWRLITLLAIMIVAFVIRFVFAFGISAGNDFALSGGTTASSHAHIIESLLNGSFAFTDPALDYPYGSVVVYPIFMDVILAGVAGVVSLFGISAGTAAAGTLAFSAPIFAALTCWPVYLIGRKMFNDEKIGLLAALLYAFFALMIMTTVFSNGTEFAFVGFLFAFMVYFMLKALDECDKAQPSGFGGVFANRALLKYTLLAGILFLLIALSWSQFRIILIVLILLMAVQAIVDRIRGKEVMPTAAIYSVIILIGMLIALPYYLAAGLWALAFSGPFIMAVLSVGLVLLFAATEKVTWVLMIPVTIIIAVAVLVVLMLFAPDLFSAVVSGNSLYTNELMANLAAQSTRTSISSMAAFFGWVTVWLPFVMFLYMVYKYRKNMDSRKYTFVMLWIFAMFSIGWFSSSYAAIAGSAFAVASAAVILMVVRMANLKDYFSEMRGNGVKHALKKTLKPIPLATVVAIVVLIIAPNAIYAADASTPTNTDGGYFGGLGYTINTDDLNSINKMWSDFQGLDKEGAMVSWLGNSTNAVSSGGFDSVTDAYGGGASAMSNILLANSSAAATAAMAIRLLLSKDLSEYKQAIVDTGLGNDGYNIIKGYIDNPSTAVQEVRDNISTYGGISRNVTQENALYLVLTNYLTKSISEPRIKDLYNSVRNISGESITYVSVDMSLLPLYYRDNSNFSTVAYLGSYNIGAYGAPTYFYSYDTTTGYATYTSAMYETFFWKALIGMSPTEAGYTSAISYLNALAVSDGTVKANPGYGMANYKIAYWHVYYNPDSTATGSTAGWKDMNALGPDGAIALQAAQGGLINYVNGVVVLQYDPTMTNELSGAVNYTSQTGKTGAEGIQVSVYVKSDTGSSASGETGYVKRSTAFTDSTGKYSILVPKDADYYVVFSSGTSITATGSVIKTVWKSEMTPNYVLDIPVTSLSGSVYVKDDPFTPYQQNSYVVIVGQNAGKTYQMNVNTSNGSFTFNNILPDIYKVTVFSPSGTIINTGSVTVSAGPTSGYMISATSGTITVTTTTDVGASAPDGTVIAAKDTLTGVVYTGTVKDGKAAISVVPATYTIYATGNKISVTNPSATVSSGGSSTASLIVYDTRNIMVSGAPTGSPVTVMSFGFITSSASPTYQSIAVPISGGSSNETYTAYALDGNNVYYGITSGTSLTLKKETGYNVAGTVKDNTGKNPFVGTVSFIKLSGDHIGSTFIFTPDADGKFNVMLPAGDYTMYIYGTLNASLSKVNVSTSGVITTTGNSNVTVSDGSLNVTASKSRDLTMTLNFRTNMSATSTRGIAFVDVKLAMTVDGVDYNIVAKTDTTGKVVFTVPQGTPAKATVAGFSTTKFNMTAQSKDIPTGSGNYSDTTSWTLAASRPADGSGPGWVNTVNVSSNVSVKLTSYTSPTVTYGPGTSLSNVIPGQYTAVTQGNDNYFNGTVYIYPGQTSLKVDATNVVRVVLTVSEKDKITVTPTDDDQGSYYADTSTDQTAYFLQRGKSFFFTAESEDGKQIAYASITASAATTLNLMNKADKAVIKGYAGVSADGTLTMTYGSVTVPFSISNGTFEITVPAGTAMTLSAKMTQTINNVLYTYTGSVSLAAGQVVNDASVRFHSTTSSSAGTLDLSGSGFSFANGRGTFNLQIKNTSNLTATYNVTAGSAWVLDKMYTVTVPGQTGSTPGTATISISGRYDPLTVGAGNPNLSVTVTNINGKAVGTYVLDAAAFPATGSTVTTPGKAPNKIIVDIRGTEGASADAVNGYEYLYAITVTNNDNYLKTVSLNATMIGSNPTWSMVYSDKDGGMIVAPGTNSFNVNGFGSTTIFVKLMCKDGKSTTVPSINVTVSSSMTGQTFASNTESKGGVTVTVNPNNVSFGNIAPRSATLEVQSTSASGNNIFNQQSGIPFLTLALLALCILLFIAMFWLGIKKGVFVRRR